MASQRTVAKLVLLAELTWASLLHRSRASVPEFPSLGGVFVVGTKAEDDCFLDGFYETSVVGQKTMYVQTTPYQCGTIERSSDDKKWILKVDRSNIKSGWERYYYCTETNIEDCVQDGTGSANKWTKQGRSRNLFTKGLHAFRPNRVQSQLRVYNVDSNGCEIGRDGKVQTSNCIAQEYLQMMMYSSKEGLSQVLAPRSQENWKVSLKKRTMRYAKIATMTAAQTLGAFVSNTLSLFLPVAAPGSEVLLQAIMKAGCFAAGAETGTLSSFLFKKFVDKYFPDPDDSPTDSTAADRFYYDFVEAEERIERKGDVMGGLKAHFELYAQKLALAQDFWEKDDQRNNAKLNRLQREENELKEKFETPGREGAFEKDIEVNEITEKLLPRDDEEMKELVSDKTKYATLRKGLSLALAWIPGAMGAFVAALVAPLIIADAGTLSGVVTLVLSIAVRVMTIKIILVLQQKVTMMADKWLFNYGTIRQELTASTVGGASAFATFDGNKQSIKEFLQSVSVKDALQGVKAQASQKFASLSEGITKGAGEALAQI